MRADVRKAFEAWKRWLHTTEPRVGETFAEINARALKNDANLPDRGLGIACGFVAGFLASQPRAKSRRRKR